MSAESFAKAVDRLLNQVSHWEQGRWSTTRSDTMRGLIQRLADLGADAEGRPRRAVPRVNDLVLRDQLRVMADDLLAAQTAKENGRGDGSPAGPEDRLRAATDVAGPEDRLQAATDVAGPEDRLQAATGDAGPEVRFKPATEDAGLEDRLRAATDDVDAVRRGL